MEMYEPPLLEQDEVEIHTPDAPPEPVQGPSTEERGARALPKAVEIKEAKNKELRSCILVIGIRRLQRLIRCWIA